MNTTATTLIAGVTVSAFMLVTSSATPPPPPIPSFSSSNSSSSSSNEIAGPNPQNRTTASWNFVQQRISQMKAAQAGTSGGGSWANPKEPVVAPVGPIHSPYFEYSYIDITESPGGPNSGIPKNTQGEHVVAVGYDVTTAAGFIFGLSYEYATRDGGVAAFDFDSHAISPYVSIPVWDNVYINLIGGYIDGDVQVPAFPLAGFTGNSWYFSPGIGAYWQIGALTVNASVSYLWNSSTVNGVGGFDADWSQIVPELGGTFDITDSLYLTNTFGYYGIVDSDFPVLPDSAWWRYSCEIGHVCNNGMIVYGRYAKDFGHNIFENDTLSIGAILTY